MAVGPSTAPQAAEKRVFQQPAGRSCAAAGAIGECEYNNNNRTIDRLFNEVNLNNLTKNTGDLTVLIAIIDSTWSGTKMWILNKEFILAKNAIES